MNSHSKKLLLGAALTGLLSGTFTNQSCASIPGEQGITSPSRSLLNPGTLLPMDTQVAPHDCKGMNNCKGQGGCKTSDKGCKGMNTCKGKCGCSTKTS
jgi:hypothetical protein